MGYGSPRTQGNPRILGSDFNMGNYIRHIPVPCRVSLLCCIKRLHLHWGAKYGYGPNQIISETGTLRSETFIFRNTLGARGRTWPASVRGKVH